MNWRSILWVAVIWMLFFYFFRMLVPVEGKTDEISYSEFKNRLRNGRVAEITIEGDKITGTQKEKNRSDAATGKSAGKAVSDAERFWTIKPTFQDNELFPLLDSQGVQVRAKLEKRSLIGSLLIAFLPWILIIAFFAYMSRRLQGGMGIGKGGGPFGFGKSKARLYDKTESNIRFADVAGLDNAKRELQETVEYMKNPSKFQAIGGELPKGILMVGPPGVGKTLLSKATAGEAGVPFFSISGSEFIEMFVGVGASRVRDLFETAKKSAPSIIFIDEIDSIGRVRGTGLGGGHDEREQTLNQILSEMDGFSPKESVLVIAATNRPDVLDPALVRPGRFDRQVALDLPQKEARKKILRTHTREVPLSDDVDFDSIASRTVGFSGADLKNLVNEAALLAARKDKNRVESEDFEEARDKILMGLEREEVSSEEERGLIAYHEAGHAVLAKLLPGADPLKKVTIIPRGRSLGATEQVPEEDRLNLKRSYLLNRITIMLGGREAENLVFRDVSTGAGDDLKRATQLAKRMICQWGMSEVLGPVNYRHGEPHPFIGKEMTEPKDFSEDTARLIDEEIRNLLRRQQTQAAEILKENRNLLDAIADHLLANETATGKDIDEIFASGVEPKRRATAF
jgi:cell division protease FtsH